MLSPKARLLDAPGITENSELELRVILEPALKINRRNSSTSPFPLVTNSMQVDETSSSWLDEESNTSHSDRSSFNESQPSSSHLVAAHSASAVIPDKGDPKLWCKDDAIAFSIVVLSPQAWKAITNTTPPSHITERMYHVARLPFPAANTEHY